MKKMMKLRILLMLFCFQSILFSCDQNQSKNNEISNAESVNKAELDKTLNDSAQKKKVWIDADVAVGMKNYKDDGYSDVDDGYAILQLFKAKQIDIKGMSAVFGNTRIDDAYRIAQKMADDFEPYEIPVFKGAGTPIDLDTVKTNAAVEALAEQLKKERLHILAIGPATNVATLVLLYPELKSQIKEVVLVAGRRSPTDHFEIGETEIIHAPDLNFDLDNTAFRVLLENDIKVVLCPFEISSKVQITQADLNKLSKADAGSQWLAKKSQPWIRQWKSLGEKGFHPFDVLASHYLMAPEDIKHEELNAHLEIHPDDMKLDSPGNHFKNYLICDNNCGSPVTYCHDIVEGYHKKMMESLLK